MELGYAHIFGAGTIFLSGMLTRRFVEMETPFKEKILPYADITMALGIALFIGMLHFININGGYQTAQGPLMAAFFTIMPEISSIIFILIAVPYFLKAAMKPQRPGLMSKVFTHIGMVSYSGYMFSMFMWDFISRELPYLGLFQPGGWKRYIVFLSIYLAATVAFATLTYNSIEKPFLAKRKKY